MRRSNGLTLAWVSTLLVAFAVETAKAERPGSARQSRPLAAHEQLKVETARRLLQTSVGAQLRARLGESAEAREFFGGTRTAELRPETVDAVLRTYNELMAENHTVAQAAERELGAAISTRAQWLPPALVDAATAERATLGDVRPGDANRPANLALLRYAEALAQRFVTPRLRTESNNAYGIGVRNIRAIAEIANQRTRDADPQAKKNGERMLALLVRAAGNHESLSEMHRLVESGAFNQPTREVENVIRGFEMTAEMRDVSTSGTGNGSPYRSMAVKLAGEGATEAQIAAKETQMREADAAVKGNGAALEARMMLEGITGEDQAALTRALRDPSKTLLDVMDMLEGFERRPGITDNARQAIVNFKQYIAGQRFFRLWFGTGRLTGNVKAVLQKLRCLLRAAGLTSPRAVAGVLAAVGTVFVGADAATAQDLEGYAPVATLLDDPSAPPRTAGAPALVGARPNDVHSNPRLGAPMTGGVVR